MLCSLGVINSEKEKNKAEQGVHSYNLEDWGKRTTQQDMSERVCKNVAGSWTVD